MWSGTFTPTLVLPPQGGGNKRKLNPTLKREEVKEWLILP